MAVTPYYFLSPTSLAALGNRPIGVYGVRFVCDTEAELPTINVIDGDLAFTNDSGRRWMRTGGAWVLQTNDISSAALVTSSQHDALPIGAVADGQFLKRVGESIVGVAGGGGGGAAWGEITGTLTDQSDLNAALASKATVSAVWPVGSVFVSVVSTNPETLLGVGTWASFGSGRVLVGLNAGDPDFDTVEKTGGAKSHTLTSAEIPSHTHVQDAHTHTQNSHNHTQDSHNHTQNSFAPRIINSGTAGTVGVQGASGASNANASNSATTATNQVATATNQAATAVNQNATATNQNTGGGGAHNNLQPFIVVYMWKRTA
jgi:microcystin-dependent protein